MLERAALSDRLPALFCGCFCSVASPDCVSRKVTTRQPLSKGDLIGKVPPLLVHQTLANRDEVCRCELTNHEIFSHAGRRRYVFVTDIPTQSQGFLLESTPSVTRETGSDPEYLGPYHPCCPWAIRYFRADRTAGVMRVSREGMA